MKSVILTVALAITTFAQANADQWLFIGEDKPANQTFYIEKDIKPTTGATRLAYMRTVNRDGSYTLMLDDYDCANRRTKTTQFIAYDSAGKLINGTSPKDKPWEPVTPQSMGEFSFNHVCRSYFAANRPPSPSAMVWTSGKPESESYTTAGLIYRFLKRNDGFIVGVAVSDLQLDSEGDLRKTAVRVVVFNESDNRVELDPTTITLTRLDQNKIIKRESAKQIASRFRTRLGIAAALGAVAASQQQEQSTSTTRGSINNSRGLEIGTYSGTTTTTSPDYEARARAQRQAQVWANNANVTAANMEQLELKAETIFARTAHTGFVFFERVKQCPSAEIVFTLAGTEFKFPVSW